MPNPIQYLLIWLIRLYRVTLSPLKSFLFGPMARCRFSPSCSVYAIEALRAHGVFRGGWLALRRICRCNPWGGCGHDPVPPAPGAKTPEAHRTFEQLVQGGGPACVWRPDRRIAR